MKEKFRAEFASNTVVSVLYIACGYFMFTGSFNELLSGKKEPVMFSPFEGVFFTMSDTAASLSIASLVGGIIAIALAYMGMKSERVIYMRLSDGILISVAVAVMIFLYFV